MTCNNKVMTKITNNLLITVNNRSYVVIAIWFRVRAARKATHNAKHGLYKWKSKVKFLVWVRLKWSQLTFNSKYWFIKTSITKRSLHSFSLQLERNVMIPSDDYAYEWFYKTNKNSLIKKRKFNSCDGNDIRAQERVAAAAARAGTMTNKRASELCRIHHETKYK